MDNDNDPQSGHAAEIFMSTVVESLFEATIDLEPQERTKILEQRCDGNAALREQVERLLVAADQAEGYFGGLGESLGLRSVFDGDLELPRDQMIGPYRLVKLIGRGGMAAVYLAKRDDAQFEQQVALKILPIGFGEEASRERFLAERQILASLAHPNIARLLDGGISETGTPYFVMEYIDGQTIDAYCQHHQLDLEQRLDLFAQVVDAVGYAHRNLIVHRDLKPPNVLVDQSGRVKLVDFGIAKLLQPSRDDAQLTQPGAHPMTLRYASPESIRGESITTASDVYSIGVLFYELMVGQPPFGNDPETDLKAEILQAPVTLPSRAVPQAHSNTKKYPPTDPSFVAASELRGDLDTIILKAIRRDPEARYQTVVELAADIQRYRQHKPILATPPSLRYRAGKFVRRRKASVAFGVAVFALLATIAVLTTRFAITTQRQSELIAQERDTAVQIRDFLIATFTSSNPNESAGESITARELLDEGVARIDTDLDDQPTLRAVMLTTFGDVYDALSLYPRARTQYEKALQAVEQSRGKQSVAYADALAKLAGIADRMGDYELTRDLASRGAELHHLLNNPAGVADNLYLLGLSLHRLGSLDEAETHHHKALHIWRSETNGDHAEIAANLAALATIHQRRGDLQEAEALHHEALKMRRRLFGDEHLDLIDSLYGSGVVAHGQKRLDVARGFFREALDIANTLNPEGSADTAFMHNGLGRVLRAQGDLSGAALSFQQSAETWETFFNGSHPNVAFALANLGEVFLDLQDAPRAEAEFRRALAIMQTSIPEHPAISGVQTNLGMALTRQDKFAEAEGVLLNGYDGLLRRHGADAEPVVVARKAVATLYQRWNRPDQAARYLPERGSQSGGQSKGTE